MYIKMNEAEIIAFKARKKVNDRTYYIRHKDQLREKYYADHEANLLRNNKYYSENKDRAKKYYQANKERQYATNLRNSHKMNITESQIQRHMNATQCDICEIDLNGVKKCADHDYKTKLYRGTVCNRCNSHILKRCDEAGSPIDVKIFVEQKGLSHDRVVRYLNFCNYTA
jgi:hypothetical protein